MLRRHLPHGKGTSATLLGTVFAHRLFDLFPIALLVAYVMATAKLPHWAVTGVVVVGLVGLGLLAVGVLSARRTTGTCPTTGSAPRAGCSRWPARASRCSATPAAAFLAILFQIIGWTLQLLAVLGGDEGVRPAAYRSPRPRSSCC